EDVARLFVAGEHGAGEREVYCQQRSGDLVRRFGETRDELTSLLTVTAMTSRVGQIAQVIHPHQVVERPVGRVEDAHQMLVCLVIVAPPQCRDSATDRRGGGSG